MFLDGSNFFIILLVLELLGRRYQTFLLLSVCSGSVHWLTLFNIYKFYYYQWFLGQLVSFSFSLSSISFVSARRDVVQEICLYTGSSLSDRVIRWTFQIKTSQQERLVAEKDWVHKYRVQQIHTKCAEIRSEVETSGTYNLITVVISTIIYCRICIFKLLLVSQINNS